MVFTEDDCVSSKNADLFSVGPSKFSKLNPFFKVTKAPLQTMHLCTNQYIEIGCTWFKIRPPSSF